MCGAFHFDEKLTDCLVFFCLLVLCTIFYELQYRIEIEHDMRVFSIDIPARALIRATAHHDLDGLAPAAATVIVVPVAVVVVPESE